MRKDTDRNYSEFRQHPQKEAGGQVKISGNFLKDHEDEIINLIKREGRSTEERTPEHRIISIDKAGDSIIVTTTAHSLAMHIGKSLNLAYKGEHKYTFSQDEQYVEVEWRRD